MPTDFAFRFATYLTLALACASAGYAEWEYLKEVSAFSGVVVALMAVAFVFDQRGYTVSLRNANIVGGGIILLMALWFSLHNRNPDSLMNTLPWPAGGLPYLVALIMVLVPAKLIRPKHVGDWWALQGLGLSMVAVGGAMTDDGLYMVLMAVYAVVGVWSLTLFYIRRVSGHVPPPPPFGPVSGARAIVSPQTYLPAWFFVARSRPTVAEPYEGVRNPTPTERLGRSHFVRALRWVGAAAIITAPLFFLTPRIEGLRWELLGSRIETGISKATVDLTRTGELHPNPKPAFTVTVTTPNGAAGSITEDTRFRVSGHNSYFHPKGIWNRTSLGHLYPVPRDGRSVWPPVPRVPPQDYGPGTVLLEYQLEPDTFGSPMADPVQHRPGQPAPIFFHHDGLIHYATSHNNGSFRIPNFDPSDRGKIRQYWQYHRSNDEVPAASWRLHDADSTAAKSRLPLLDLASKRIESESRLLLERMFRDRTLPPAIRDRADPATLLPAPEDHLTVARAFERHFAISGEYEYSLNLRRFDRNLDPIEDFLFHTKSGHCERFASGLTLMLRGVGIPAQFVIGYRGCIEIDPGKYLVRQDHAHAWVEILVSERIPGTLERDWHWQTLDPTAGTRDEQDTTANGTTGSRFISAFITGLTPERQKQLVEDIAEFGTQYSAPALATLAIAGGLVVLAIWVRRRLQQTPEARVATAIDPVPWFSRLVAILARGGCVWPPGQTPSEFARAAVAWLAARPATAALAAIPERAVGELERHRYAGLPLNPDAERALRDDLDRLDAAIPIPE
jgi:protein-glutamine gamma-glutamyltransferase